MDLFAVNVIAEMLKQYLNTKYQLLPKTQLKAKILAPFCVFAK